MKKLLVIASNTHFLDWLKEVPWDVKVWAFPWSNMSTLDKGVFYLTFKLKLNLVSRTYDVVFCDWFDHISALASKSSSKPIFVRAHRCEVDSSMGFKMANLGNVKAIITVTNAKKKNVRDIIGDSIPIYVVPNGVDTQKFTYNPYVHRPLKICSVSYLSPKKRLFDLIVNDPELKMDIGGIGLEHRTLAYAIRKFKSNARLFGWVELPEFYHNHDIFIMNSEDEGFPVVLIEAMSCGLIPLCFAWDGVEEILPQDNIYQNYEELQEKIQKIKQMSHTEIIRLKKKMRHIVGSKFTLEQQAKNFISLFEKM